MMLSLEITRSRIWGVSIPRDLVGILTNWDKKFFKVSKNCLSKATDEDNECQLIFGQLKSPKSNL